MRYFIHQQTVEKGLSLSPLCQLKMRVFCLVLTHPDAWDHGWGQKILPWEEPRSSPSVGPASWLWAQSTHSPGSTAGNKWPLPGVTVPSHLEELPSRFSRLLSLPKETGSRWPWVESPLRENSKHYFHALLLPELLSSLGLCLNGGPWRRNRRTSKPSWALRSLAKADKDLGK